MLEILDDGGFETTTRELEAEEEATIALTNPLAIVCRCSLV
jgi:hypothetical protein